MLPVGSAASTVEDNEKGADADRRSSASVLWPPLVTRYWCSIVSGAAISELFVSCAVFFSVVSCLLCASGACCLICMAIIFVCRFHISWSAASLAFVCLDSKAFMLRVMSGWSVVLFCGAC